MKTGTIVAWDAEESDVLNKIVPIFNDASVTPYIVETEDLDYVELENSDSNVEDLKEFNEGNPGSFVSKEIICLSGSPGDKLLDKVAFSYGISRSTRLAILESSLERHINMTKDTTKKLSRGERLRLSAKDVLSSSGRLLLLRGKLNLYSQLTETPDLYWDEPNLEKIYTDISKVLEVNARANVLNKKLDYASEDAQTLVELLKSRNESKLEWIIIYLIVIEVCFETHHFYERFLEKNSESKAVQA
ncbi:unnamed protein product [Ambrosiozyma monospora]|uniref:Unnamed protein product n=1 Tax=Ambrosiozyma monospora TaxID=43982 RepID=A0ACB5TXV7_AMBMO|nr:unnamed protein product [Ambrosiozyma monospora]